ncbi:hypothetical protein GE21DRAFT_1072147 [Neurospora crassa]|nr:hypothetical protein GE21DRAFT_1072147 [Neurospora crassa]
MQLEVDIVCLGNRVEALAIFVFVSIVMVSIGTNGRCSYVTVWMIDRRDGFPIANEGELSSQIHLRSHV